MPCQNRITRQIWGEGETVVSYWVGKKQTAVMEGTCISSSPQQHAWSSNGSYPSFWGHSIPVETIPAVEHPARMV